MSEWPEEIHVKVAEFMRLRGKGYKLVEAELYALLRTVREYYVYPFPELDESAWTDDGGSVWIEVDPTFYESDSYESE